MDRAYISRDHIVILDYKHGHRFVSEVENWQLLSYLRAVLDWLAWPDLSGVRFSLGIMQPRAYDRRGFFRVWEIPAGTDMSRYWATLRNSAAAALQPDPVAVSGAHCLDCPGRAKCEALRQSGNRVLSVTAPSAPLTLSATEAASEYALLAQAQAILKARMAGLEDEMIAKYQSGERGFGYAVERAQTRLVWSCEPEKVALLGQLYGAGLETSGVKTPTQAIAAGVPEEIVLQYAGRPLGEPKLIKTEHTTAHRAFFKGK